MCRVHCSFDILPSVLLFVCSRVSAFRLPLCCVTLLLRYYFSSLPVVPVLCYSVILLFCYPVPVFLYSYDPGSSVFDPATAASRASWIGNASAEGAQSVLLYSGGKNTIAASYLPRNGTKSWDTTPSTWSGSCRLCTQILCSSACLSVVLIPTMVRHHVVFAMRVHTSCTAVERDAHQSHAV